MPALAAPGPPSPPFLCQPGPPVLASRHGLWLAGEGVALWPPPAPQNRDVSPHGWGPGLLGHAPVCQESPAATCVFTELVRGFWEAAHGCSTESSQALCGPSVIEASPQRPSAFWEMSTGLAPLMSCYLDLMCVSVYPQIHVTSLPCLWACLFLCRSSHGVVYLHRCLL